MADAPQQPNVVFFIVDDTPHENLGTWGGPTPTPNLIGELEAGEVVIDGATFVIDDGSTVLYRRFVDWYGALGEVGILGASRVIEADEIDDQVDLAAS